MTDLKKRSLLKLAALSALGAAALVACSKTEAPPAPAPAPAVAPAPKPEPLSRDEQKAARAVARAAKAAK